MSKQPANHRQLHWAQAKVYGWLMCRKLDLERINLALVYFDIVSERETCLLEVFSAAELKSFFEEHCARFLHWAEQEMAHREARNRAAQQLAFPHAGFRPGQRHLAESVFKAVSTGRCLMAQAPTGIGKTVGTLFPMLKAMAPRQLDKVFFLTAKTPGRKLALDAAQVIIESADAPPLRVLEMIARDKACEHPDKACHGESCPLAQGFYDRLPAARQAASELKLLNQGALRQVALDHAVCPYYLSQEMARWADVVVADYNYYFDFSALLFGLAQANNWTVAVLVDEAHNLVERGRQMYSASLDQATLNGVRKTAPEALKSPCNGSAANGMPCTTSNRAPTRPMTKPRKKLLQALSSCSAGIGDYLNDHPQGLDSALQSFYFEMLQFCRVAELFDGQFLFDISKRDLDRKRCLSQLCLRNVVPAGFIGPRLTAARSTVLFSATLSPRHYYADLLGTPLDTVCIDVESPFHADQLQVHIVDRISTRFVHREASLAPIVELIANQFIQRPGNYLAFFSSFDYLQQVAQLLAERHPQINLWTQSRGMAEEQRQQFLDQFTEGGEGIGFAVLGGAFGEGIDLPGARLIGAFIATLGLAQLNPVNEQLKRRMAAIFGAGYDYTYLFPGVQKVVQAAGRVIRTQQDQGVVMLIDDRFAESKVRQLLPRWWSIAPTNVHSAL